MPRNTATKVITSSSVSVLLVDIGLHLGCEALNGKARYYESAGDPSITRALLDEDFAESEIDRYSEVRRHASTYNVGEQVWINTREGARIE